MILSDAPTWLILSHFKLNYLHRIFTVRKSFKKKQESFREYAKDFHIDNDWFSPNIPTWLMAFRKQSYEKNSALKCLEIGSWQGQSALFLLSYFAKADLTCVDTWEGADEHKDNNAPNNEILSKVEMVFDANLSGYKDRVTKYKGNSYQYFNDYFERDKFDFIYIDGSHHSDDVLVDAIKAFEMLKVGGLMIFDDYFWKYYRRTIDNPSGAINAFVRLKRYQIEVICFDYQLAIKKSSPSVR